MIASIEKEGNGSRIKREGDAMKRVMTTKLEKKGQWQNKGKRGVMAKLGTPRVRNKERWPRAQGAIVRSTRNKNEEQKE
jgi:hypothetical protein